MLRKKDLNKIKKLLGRDPTELEAGLFEALWSEHCGYRSSKHLLKKLPRKAPWVVASKGENAGAVEIGDGLVVAFKMESHNHPSAIEPFQGAATGIGGIIRDVLALGLRPFALADPLRFGPLTDPKNVHLLEGVVKGIAWYGNCIGVPTVCGEVQIHPSYSKNPLVNVMAVACGKKEEILTSKPSKPGLKIIYLGNATGRDGIHGASFASETLGEEDKRPAVQIGDPFMEKLLIEAILEINSKKLADACQDMGAAGLTSSTFEMAWKGGLGLKLYLDEVPTREENMTPYELMLSESQERMAIAAAPEKVEEIMKIAKKWGINAKVIGEFTPPDADGPKARLYWKGEEIANIKLKHLVEAPVEKHPVKKPKVEKKFEIPPLDLEKDLLELLKFEDVKLKPEIYTQYDHSVMTGTVLSPGQADCAVLRIRNLKNKFLAITTDGNGRLVYLDPFWGTVWTVIEAVSNLACAGAKPLAITNCLNFGSPEDPHVYYTFVKSVEGLAWITKKLKIPVVSGNVSFYNQPEGGPPVLPTPVIGMIGTTEKIRKLYAEQNDLLIVLVGEFKPTLSGSLYQWIKIKKIAGTLNKPNLKKLKRTLKFVRIFPFENVHDISDGGLLVALAEMLIQTGGQINIEETAENLFGECRGCFVATVKQEFLNVLLDEANKFGVKIKIIGKTGGGVLKINSYTISLQDLKQAYGFQKTWA